MLPSLHLHVYFSDDTERAAAMALREALSERFPTAALGRVHERPIAFHPAPMYQVALNEVPLGTVIPWLQRHRRGLTVLVHPLTGDVVREHTTDAIWLGRPLDLDTAILDRHASARIAPDAEPARRPTVLRIDASARREGSVSRWLGDALVERLVAQDPTREVVHRDLADGLPLLDPELVAATRGNPADRTPAQREASALSDALVDELRAADAVVIGLPIYNFHAPAAFKAWIDLVARPRLTFRYTPDGPKGLLEDKPVYVVISSGGTRLGSEIDFLSGWLRKIFGFLGITDLHLVRADGQVHHDDRPGDAKRQIEALFPARKAS